MQTQYTVLTLLKLLLLKSLISSLH
jgi:hypothetical protein